VQLETYLEMLLSAQLESAILFEIYRDAYNPTPRFLNFIVEICRRS
jgi:hypothetical protein